MLRKLLLSSNVVSYIDEVLVIEDLDDEINISLVFADEVDGMRLDQALAAELPDYSRERLKSWVKSGECLVNGKKEKPNLRLKGGESVEIKAQLDDVDSWNIPEDIPLDVIYEDKDLLVVNKPKGLVVHPGAGNKSGTLVNGLLHYIPELKKLPRAGIVHRIDKDTTGLLLVAKTLSAHTYLSSQMQEKKIQRQYLALVYGEVISGKTIDAPIGRSPKERTKMAIVNNGREAITHYRLKNKYRKFTLLDVKLDTGRTHQIRVHLAHDGYPIVGDFTYGPKRRCPSSFSNESQEVVNNFNRQALHAYKIGFVRPGKKKLIELEAELPEDFKLLLKAVNEEV